MLINVENCSEGRQIEIEWREDKAAYLFQKNLLDTITATDCPLAEPQMGALAPDDSFRVITKTGQDHSTPIGLVSCYAACNHMKPAKARQFLLSKLMVAK